MSFTVRSAITTTAELIVPVVNGLSALTPGNHPSRTAGAVGLV